MLKSFVHLRFTVILHDVFMTWLAWTLSYVIRFSLLPESSPLTYFSKEIAAVLLIQGTVAYYFGLYKGLWRFASIPDLWNIVRSALLGTLLIGVFYFLLNRADDVPRSILMIYPVLLVLLWGIPRISYRLWKDHRFPGSQESKNVLLIGAGKLCDMFIRNASGNSAYKIIGILDADKKLKGANIRGITIFGGLELIAEMCTQHEIDLIVISQQNPSADTIRQIVDGNPSNEIKIRILPDPDDLARQSDAITQLKPLTVDDLLGRDKVEMDWSKVAEFVRNKSILVTGGGGSIGSELCRQLSRFGVEQLTILDNSEYNLYRIDKELSDGQLLINPHLCDISNKSHLYHIFKQVKPDVVFHAAAYKHVPLLENLGCEAYLNNVVGTQVVADTCDQFEVQKMVLISTDKAVNPYSVMGATKRLAEKYCQYKNNVSATDYLIVRFGNVLGSAGSVVPLFQEQIEQGGPVTVTHPEMTRYFMTIQEACQLILQTTTVGEKGSIMVLDMGHPIRIKSLAERMIALSGKHHEIEIVYTGLRSGEKLNEQLFYEVEALNRTRHNKIFVVNSELNNAAKLPEYMQQAHQQASQFDAASLQKSLHKMVPEFNKDQSLELLKTSDNS